MDAGGNVEGTVTHDKPLILRVWQHNEPAALRPLIAVALAAARHSGVTPVAAQATAAKLNAASRGEMRRWSSGPLERSSRSAPLMKSPVSTTTPSLRHSSWTRSNNAMHTDRLFCKLVVDVHVCHCEERARLVRAAAELPVTTMPSSAHEEYLCAQGTWTGVHVYGPSR